MKGKGSDMQAADCRVLIEKEDVELLMRSERWHAAGAVAPAESASAAAAELCRMPHLESKDIDVAKLTEITADDIIDRFLRSDNYRIVADEAGPAEEIRTEAEFDGEDDLVSEELAEVYRAQGLNDMARETYRKLSLLNPEKSIYFAQLIAELDGEAAAEHVSDGEIEERNN